MSRVQLALNVEDVDESVAFYSKLFGTEPAKRPARLRQLRRSLSRHSSWCCWRTRARAAPSTTWESRWPTSTRSTPNRPGSRSPGWPPSTSAAPPVATRGRTSSGCRARRTASVGRSTPCWPTVRPSLPSPPTELAAAGSRTRPPPRLPQRARAAADTCGPFARDKKGASGAGGEPGRPPDSRHCPLPDLGSPQLPTCRTPSLRRADIPFSSSPPPHQGEVRPKVLCRMTARS